MNLTSISIDRLHASSFFAFTLCMVSYEAYYFFQDVLLPLGRRLSKFWNSFSTVYHDFKSGRYYKPWSTNSSLYLVSSKKHMMELSETPTLSQRAVYADMFGFKFTMNNLEHDEIKVARSRLYGRLLLVNGPKNLAGLFDAVHDQMIDSFAKVLRGGLNSQGTITVPCTRLSKEIASRAMSTMIFGPTLTSEHQFYQALLQYPKDMINSMLAFQMTPTIASRFMHNLVTRGGKAMHTIQNRLMTVMKPECEVIKQDGRLKDYVAVWRMAEVATDSNYWTYDSLSQSLLGIWFAASHQPWMNLNFIILELCARPEWQSILRDEIENAGPLTWKTLDSLPLLDSFIKETIRMNPLDTLAIRRKALAPFTFSGGGPIVPTGSIACVSSYNLMHNHENYPDPERFDGRRFLGIDNDVDRNFIGVSAKFPVWGFGSLACPGRHYASTGIKSALAHLIMNFDFRLEDGRKRNRWMWETFTMPCEGTMLLLNPRERVES